MKFLKFLLLFTSALTLANFAFGQTWTQLTNAPNKNWSCIASSADGGKLIALGLGYCYTSTNSGAAWISNSEPQSVNPAVGYWYNVASSADGTKLLATTVSSVISVSTNAGMTWLSNNVPSVIVWGPVAMSADGSTLVAAAGGNGHPPGFIYISTDWGMNWTPTSAPTNVWVGLASSADGTKLVAVTGTPFPFVGAIYTSTNSGIIWTQTSAPSKYWSSVASSADGAKLAAVNFAETSSVPGHIFTSIDFGKTWVSNSLVSGYFGSVALSADGNTVVVGGQPSSIDDVCVSTNFGATWTSNLFSSDLVQGYITSVASSADGSKLFATAFGGLIYTSQTTPTPQLNIISSVSNLALSWLIPSTNYVLQESSDLISWSILRTSQRLISRT